MVQVSKWWAASYEKGATLGHFHIQAVAVMDAVSCNQMKKDWYEFSGWNENRPRVKKVSVMFREATGKGLHTQYGLLGYIRKDCARYDGHLFFCDPSVTEEEMREGDMLYVKFGKGNKGNPCQLTEVNILDRALQ